MVGLLRALEAPRRREILRLVWDRERAAGEVHRALGDVTFGAVSQHLKKLEAEGLVVVRRDGRHRYYRADKSGMGPLAQYLETMWRNRLGALVERVEQVEAERRDSEGEDI